MAASSAWIIWEAIQRIVHPTKELHDLGWPVAVVLCSIGVDFWRSRRLRAVAVRTGSPALATDAFHFASDIWSSLAVLCGLGASWVGMHFGVSALRYADPLAAVVVSLLILRLTLRLGRETVSVLSDEIPAETPASWCARPLKRCIALCRRPTWSSTRFRDKPERRASSTVCAPWPRATT